MLKANTRQVDDHRAALAILGFMRGDANQLHFVLDEAAQEAAGPAGLILALTEAAAVYAHLAADDAEAQLAQIVLELATAPE